MDSARWEKVQVLFEDALDRAADARKAFLRQACAGDDDLFHEVAALLDEDQHTHSLLDGVALDATDLLGDLTREGQQVGAYVLARQLGAGGMGAVYLAQRADGAFDQQVALKLVKRGMDSEQILRRFRSERQILARLQHPNIARLLDGGVTADGQPYFVMEYVDGLPIDRYCDEHQLSVDARLTLFQEVCRAVLYAHANLVVHRDLKPSNILVTEGRDGVPKVKLLDFGIAKVLVEEGEEATALTREGVAVMTPEYASPEQVRGETVSTSTDIYSLGVVLYELLTGVRPYVIAGRSPVDVVQVVCSTEPERPSTAVGRASGESSGGDSSAEVISRARATEVGRLRRRLSGDLDVICLKALKKEAERRYASVEAFMEDLRRHLSGLPVLARPDTVAYRVKKFTARHRVGVVATVLVVLMIAMLVGFYTVRLARERDRAQVEAEKAEQVAAFLQGIFEVSNPSESKGATVTAQELLTTGAARVEEELADQPEVQSQMMHVIGDVYLSLGLYDEAEAIIQKALDRRHRFYGAEHAEVAASQATLARIRLEQGDYAAAESLHTQALAVRRKLLGHEHPEVAESLQELAWLRQLQGDVETAIALNREMLALRRKLFGDEHTLVAVALNNLANALMAHGETDEAEPLFRESLALQEKLHGDDHPEVANTMNNLALMLQERGEHAAAEPLYRRVLAIDLQTLGTEHAYVAISKNNLAQALQGQGAYAEAESLFQESLALRQQLFGEVHPAVAESFNNLGILLVEQGRFDEAEPLMRNALAINREVLGPEHPRTAITINGLAGILHRQGNLPAADAMYREALALYGTVFPEGHVRRANPLFGLGSLLADQENCSEAIPLLRQALDLRRAGLREGHRDLANAASYLGGCLTMQQQFDEAEPLLLEGFENFRREQGEDSNATRRAAARLVTLYEAWDKPEATARYRALASTDS